MRKRKVAFAVGLYVALSFSVLTYGQSTSADMQDEVEQSAKAAQVFREIMSAPDKAIPQRILDDAECVAVFPSVIKAAFGIGARGGRGVASCRTPEGWSAPAFLNLGGASFGAQIGVDSTDYVMLFMTPEAARNLVATNFKVGAGAGVSAGPVGRQVEAATDAKVGGPILSYSRSKGLFAGAALEGAVIETAGNDMRDVYGSGHESASPVLFDGTVKGPKAAAAFSEALAKYSPAKRRVS